MRNLNAKIIKRQVSIEQHPDHLYLSQAIDVLGTQWSGCVFGEYRGLPVVLPFIGGP